MAKEKKAKKQKGQDAEGAATGLRLADHPRATAQIRAVRAWVALAAFALAAYRSHGAGHLLEQTLTSALTAGFVAFVATWGVMVLAWRQLAQAELEMARRRIVEAMREQVLEREAAESGPSARGA